MRLVQADEAAGRIFERETGRQIPGPYAGLLVVDDDDQPRGLVVMSNKTDANAELSVFGHNCWTVKVVREICRWAFITNRLKRVTARMRKDNKPARRAVEKLGCQLEGTHKQYYADGVACMTYGLLAREQKIVRL